MPDPFERLRESIVALAPPVGFAAELEHRLRVRLGLSTTREPATMSHNQHDIWRYTPARYRSVTAYLAVQGAADAIAWYGRVFGAVEVYDRIVMDDGRVGHAELRLGDSIVQLADEFPEIGHLAPSTEGSGVSLHVYVADSAATVALAEAEGAAVLSPVGDPQYGERGGTIRDPWGHRWMVATHVEHNPSTEDVPGRRHGDLYYVTVQGPSALAQAPFYESVLGWRVEPGTGHIGNTVPPIGLFDAPGEPRHVVYFRVDDLTAACERVRAAGGTVVALNDYDSGASAECLDPQGLRFDLSQAAPGY